MNKKTQVAIPVTVVAALLGGALLWGNAAKAVQADEPAGNVLVKVSDQQNVTTDATGRVTLDLRNGEKNQRCLDTERIESFTVQLAGNKSGGRDPLFVQTAQNTNCTIKLRFFDINTQPIAGHVVRLGYTADGQVQTFADGAAPAPEPEPEPTAEPPTEEPTAYRIIVDDGCPKLNGPEGFVLKSGSRLLVDPDGPDVPAGNYSGTVKDGETCFIFFEDEAGNPAAPFVSSVKGEAPISFSVPDVGQTA